MTEKKEKHAGGAPPKPPPSERFDMSKIEQYAALGLNDVQIGGVLGVTERTINNWKKDPEFFSALKRGKLRADMNAVKSLYEMTQKRESVETTEIKRTMIAFVWDDTLKKEVRKPVTLTTTTTKRKTVDPDVTAIIYWLNNRWKDLWRARVEHTIGGTIDHNFQTKTEKEIFEELVADLEKTGFTKELAEILIKQSIGFGNSLATQHPTVERNRTSEK